LLIKKVAEQTTCTKRIFYLTLEQKSTLLLPMPLQQQSVERQPKYINPSRSELKAKSASKKNTIMPEVYDFNNTAQKLSRNPLGIIALFIVLVYGFAAMVLGLAKSSLDSNQRWPLIYFLVLFPVLVLFVFAWLVRYHHWKLYGVTEIPDRMLPYYFGQSIAIQNMPTPKGNEPITAKNLTLRYSCWRAAKHDARFDYKFKVYRFDAVVLAPNEILEKIDFVIYHLPPAWKEFGGKSKHKINFSNTKFKLEELTFADIFLYADVHFKADANIYPTSPNDDAKNVISLSCFIQLSESGPRI
jgi:hypothetical protein